MLGTNDYFKEQRHNFAPIATVLASSAVSYGAWRAAGKVQTGGQLSKYRWLSAGIKNFDTLGINPTLQGSIWNAVKGFEETFGGFFRTFDLSTILSSSALQGSRFDIQPDDVKAFKGYYSKLFNMQLSEMDILSGIKYDAGKVFVGNQQVPGYYSLIQRLWDPQVEGRTPMHSRMAQSYQTAMEMRAVAHGAADMARGPFPGASNVPFLIVGGENHLTATTRRAQAFGLTLSKRYFRMLDDPVEFVGELFNSSALQNFREKYPRIGGFYSKFVANKLGLGRKAGKELGSMSQLWGRHAAQLGKYVVVGSFLYHTTDNLLADTLGVGLSGIGASIYQTVDMTLANLSYWSGLTSIRRQQEQISPGSASKGAMLAFPVSGFVTGGFLAAGTNLGKFMQQGPAALEHISKKAAINGLLGDLPYLRGKVFRKSLRWGVTGAGVGALVSALISLPMGLGWLGHSKTPDELKAIYSGQQDVAVRRARWWEFSRTPWEGSTIDYWRPHLSVAIKDRYKEKALFGDGENFLFRALKQTEILKDIVSPYYFEEKFYYDRPYPIAGGESTGLGPISAIYNLTFAKLFKPSILMHKDELERGAGLQLPARGGVGEVIYESGAIIPYGSTTNLSQIENLMQRMTDAIGLPGYLLEMKNQRLSGQRTWFGSQVYLQNSSEISSSQRNFWDMSLGSLMGTTEAYRRLQPPKSRENIYVNNIPNTQPDWMPNRFQFGDPYTKVPMGEYRIPGRGYEARFPYLSGVAPTDYPLVNRLQVLGDIAPFSREFRQTREEAESLYGSFSNYERELYDKIIFQRDQEMKGREFAPVPENPFSLLFSTVKNIALLNPLEYLLPVSPIHKLAGPFDPLSDYKVNMIYAKEYTSWASPIQDYVKPAAQVAAHGLLGLEFIPEGVKQQRNIEEYFDRLKYIKYRFLSEEAKSHGDYASAKLYAEGASETLTGVNPYSDQSLVFKAANGRERYYLRAFENIRDADAQEQVLQYTPKTYHKIYRSAWLERRAADKLSTENREALGRSQQAQGEEINDELIRQYYGQTGERDLRNYAEWKRIQETEQFFEENGGIPSPDFVGWHPSVDLNDVKLEFVKNLGLDMHDFDLWENNQIGMNMRPYGELAAEQLRMPDRRNSSSIQTQLTQMLHRAGYENIRVQVNSERGFTGQNSVRLNVDEDSYFDATYQEKFK